MISRFRLFESGPTFAETNEIRDYLDLYHSEPLTKATLLNRIADGKALDQEAADLASKFQIKRRGRDQDDIFWLLGKIHGGENLAFATEEELADAGGDPFRLQTLADKINDREKPAEFVPASPEKLVQLIHEELAAYKKAVDATP